MTNLTNTGSMWRWGIGAGAVAALLDVSLILAVDDASSKWVLLEAALFWTTAGWAVVASNSGLGRFGHGVLATVILSLPWYVVTSFAAGHPEHLAPLLVMGILFGCGFGWARGRALQATPRGAAPSIG